jgi:SET domain-containing protein
MLLVPTFLSQSPIHGLGLFAAESVSQGAVVWKFAPGFDLTVAPDELDRLSDPALRLFRRYAYLDRLLGEYVLCFDDARFMNHSAAPNLDDVSEVRDGMGVTVAARDVHAGEELTCDYAAFDAEWGSYSLEADPSAGPLREQFAESRVATA